MTRIAICKVVRHGWRECARTGAVPAGLVPVSHLTQDLRPGL